MATLELDVPDDIAEELERRASEADLSVAAYIAAILDVDGSDDWPEDFFDQVAGGWEGASLERPEQGEFEERDDL
ncbi:MAG: hypothetical protein ABEL76_09840 [Bradymonadaceae bacterium]